MVANEVAFRAVSQLPWIEDHLADLVGRYADAVKIDPTRFSGLMAGGTDPEAIEAAIEQAGGIESILGGEEADGPRLELEAFLGTVTGCGRLLARRSVRRPGAEFRSNHRGEGPGPHRGRLANPDWASGRCRRRPPGWAMTSTRRWSVGTAKTPWRLCGPTRPGCRPQPSSRDPTAWAARVLLDGWN